VKLLTLSYKSKRARAATPINIERITELTVPPPADET
jgi:hypothetical protein